MICIAAGMLFRIQGSSLSTTKLQSRTSDKVMNVLLELSATMHLALAEPSWVHCTLYISGTTCI